MALTINNLGVVRKEVLEACTKWYDIGLELNIPVATLDSIEGQFGNHSEKLRETLKVWLKTATEPKWQDIVAVLESHVVAEPKLASDVEAKHCTTTETGQASGQMMPAAKRPKTTDTLLEQALQENRELRIKEQDSQRLIGTLQLELHLQEIQREVEEYQREVKELTRQREEDYQEQQITKAKHRKDLQEHEQTNQELRATNDRLKQQLQQQQASLRKHEQTNQELRATNDQLKRQLQQQQATGKNLQKHEQTNQKLRAMKNLLEFQPW